MRPETADAPSETETAVPQQSARGSQRSKQIVRVAADLFEQVGYQNVSIDQIGAAVGLTGPAVYRHFKSKHLILVKALMEQVAIVEAMAERADNDATSPQDRLDRFMSDLTDLAVDRDETLLWRREQRHLQATEQKAFRTQFAAVRTRVVKNISAAYADTTEEGAQLLGYALLSMYTNTRDIGHGLSSARLLEVQSAIARSIVECRLPVVGADAQSATDPTHRLPAGRRERIIDASAALFDARGFYDVRIDDIAKASRMSVATLYQHVTGKAQVLEAILERGAEGLLYVTANALSTSESPEQSLNLLIHTYIEQAFGVHGRIMRILATDLIYLPEESQVSLRNAQREYVAEWIEVICALAPQLAPTDARALAHSVIGVITDLSQTPRVRKRPGVIDELEVLAKAMILPSSLVRPD